MCKKLALILLVLFLQNEARAGVILDGVPDSSYLAWAAQFPSMGRVGGASGTLIAPDWVLTAGHVGLGNFTIGGNTYTGTQFIAHPQFIANGGDLNYGYDIGLIKLSTPVVGITPANIYTGNNEVNSTVSITGFGATGVGSSANPTGGGVARAGTNVIDFVLSFSNGTGGQIGAQNALLLSDFDAPAGIGTAGQYNTTGSATPTSLEYQLAGGDSGGGVFINENGQWYLAGVNSGVDSQRGVTGSGNNQLYGYGGVSAFTRVSSYQSFVINITGVPEPSSMLLGLIAMGGIGAIKRFGRRERTSMA